MYVERMKFIANFNFFNPSKHKVEDLLVLSLSVGVLAMALPCRLYRLNNSEVFQFFKEQKSNASGAVIVILIKSSIFHGKLEYTI